MAFDVTPTSGASPYTFTATFTNKEAFDSGYTLRMSRGSSDDGVCPLPEEATINMPTAPVQLLEDGVYIRPEPVPSGTCMTFRLRIFDLFGAVVDSQHVSVDNYI